jgi:hypothetical protein
MDSFKNIESSCWYSKYWITSIMDNLFDHPGFRLIFIGDDGMSLISPLGHKEAILENGYRCISHYWGPTPPEWDHPVKGVGWKVHVREEKWEQLLRVLNHYKGYFWMDVFCTNQEDKNKPLDVMGDIYRNCRECVCLLDVVCNISEFESEKDVWRYMGMKFCRHEYHILKDEGAIRKKCQAYFLSVSGCNWFKRVWTWQEAVLPPKLLFCSEMATSHKYDPLDLEFLETLLNGDERLYLSVSKAHRINETWGMHENVFKCSFFILRLCKKSRDILDDVKLAINSQRTCTNTEDFVYGITGVLNLSIPKGLTLDRAMIELDYGLQKQGIFMGYGCEYSFSYDHGTLGRQYEDRKPLDGIIVLGKIYDVKTIREFNPDVSASKHKTYGRILSKNIHGYTNARDDVLYGHICHRYETETLNIFLETNKFNVGDILETTLISRKKCKFDHEYKRKREKIYEIRANRVDIIGYISCKTSITPAVIPNT